MHDLMQRFAKTVELGSISAAARELHISQPAVTKSLQLLAEHYKVQLLERGAGGVVPTEYGQIIYRFSKILQKSIESVADEINARKQYHAGRLTIGAGLLWCYVYLPAALEKLSKQLPELKIDVLLRPPSKLHDLVCQGELEIGVGQLPPERVKGIVYEELLISQSAVFAHRDHPLTTQQRFRESDLRKYPWAKFAAASGETATTISGGNENHVTTMDNLLLACLLMQDGRHLMRLPRALSCVLEKFDLIPLPHRSTEVKFVSGLFYPETTLLKSASRAMVDEIRNISKALSKDDGAPANVKPKLPSKHRTRQRS